MTTGDESEEYALTLSELDKMAKKTGCSQHDNCLTCPLPNCIYDTSHRLQHQKTVLRQANIRRMYMYHSVEAIAEQLNITTRTVYRAMKEK